MCVCNYVCVCGSCVHVSVKIHVCVYERLSTYFVCMYMCYVRVCAYV